MHTQYNDKKFHVWKGSLAQSGIGAEKDHPSPCITHTNRHPQLEHILRTHLLAHLVGESVEVHDELSW